MTNPIVNSAKRLYPNEITKAQVKKLVPLLISAEQYMEITGEAYSE